MTDAQFLNAVALGQITPGPVVCQTDLSTTKNGAMSLKPFKHNDFGESETNCAPT
jgi:hypothetical protein